MVQNESKDMNWRTEGITTRYSDRQGVAKREDGKFIPLVISCPSS